MRKKILNKLLFFAILQLFIFSIQLLLYNKISIDNYINISFYFSSFLLLSGLFIFVIHRGFFDAPAKAFTILQSRNHEKNKQLDEVRPLSKLIAFNYTPLFFYGLLTGAGMLVALFFYYQ